MRPTNAEIEKFESAEEEDEEKSTVFYTYFI
jgi:hypothetical protein